MPDRKIFLFIALSIGAIFANPLPINAAPPKVVSSAAADDLDKLFYRADGWIGGDGGNSVVLPSRRMIWLFSDTWIGRVRDGRRLDAAMVNNTIGLQSDPRANAQYFFKRGSDGKPAAMILPADGRGWFWLQSGLMDGKCMQFFLNQVEKTDDNGVFGFRSTGVWLGSVQDAEQPVESWDVKQVKLPNTIFTDKRVLTWGASTVRVGNEIFVYGTDEIPAKEFPKRVMVVARVPLNSLADFSTWKYFHDGQWVEDIRECTPLANDFATEFSVTPCKKGFFAVYTHVGFSPKIMGRTADEPWGPWSEPVVLHTCPEMARDKNLFCYGAKAHPALSSDDEIVINYFVNTLDFWQVFREADLYWPRFVRVKLE